MASQALSSLLGELLDAIDQDSSNVEASKLLAQQYQLLEWHDAAADIAEAALAYSPHDREAQAILAACRGRSRLQTDTSGDGLSNGSHDALAIPSTEVRVVAETQTVERLSDGYKALRKEAEELVEELLVFQRLAPDVDLIQQMADLTGLSNGKMFSVAKRKIHNAEGNPTATGREEASATDKKVKKVEIRLGSPCSAVILASSMKRNPTTALEIAIEDFTDLVHWCPRNRGLGAIADMDFVRNALRKRVEALVPGLPTKMRSLPSQAFMHVEHEVLKKSYVNSETMYGDPVSDIPRSNFWVSEDGYAWDVEELVQAIKAKKGATRNPLSNENFTSTDIEAIIIHPVGKHLAALQVEQSELVKGVRLETVARLKSMATALLNDLSGNTLPSHQAIDDFLAYVSTLPAVEREAIDKLRVPAVDSHSGQRFDDTIGDAVRDAKGNRICLHKAGDVLKQAAEFLSRSRQK